MEHYNRNLIAEVTASQGMLDTLNDETRQEGESAYNDERPDGVLLRLRGKGCGKK